MYHRRGTRKGNGPSFCHHCYKQLQLKVGGGFYFTVMLTPMDLNEVRVHMQCVNLAREDGYRTHPTAPVPPFKKRTPT